MSTGRDAGGNPRDRGISGQGPDHQQVSRATDSVKASIGHVRDLPKSQFGVDVENDFAPRYITIRGKGKVLNEFRESAKKAERVLLATDPDREGEAISWHLVEALKLNPDDAHRIQFHEITAEAVKEALRAPRPIDRKLVDAYQARRVLDRIVGYKLSPLLWRKVKAGLERRPGRSRWRCVSSPTASGRSKRSCPRNTGPSPAPSPRRRAPTGGPGHGLRLSCGAAGERKARPARRGDDEARPRAELENAQYVIKIHQEGRAPPPPGAALHHQHPAAGSLPQAGLLGPQDHDAWPSSSTKA